MSTTNIIGKVESSTGYVQIIGVDGMVREALVGENIYEGETLVSGDTSTLLDVKYSALGEVTSYQGVFSVLVDASVVAELDETETQLTEEEILALLDDEEGTAAGEEGSEGNSGVIVEEGAVARSNVQGFNRGENGELGMGITSFEVSHGDDQTPPIITSLNSAVFDEGDGSLRAEGDVVLTVTSDDTSVVSYSLVDGLDSAFFVIDSKSGELKFITSPDFENPQDSDGDNEYNVEVQVTDALGNSTTQLISVSINNINDNAPVVESAASQLLEDSVEGVNGQLIGSDADGDNFNFVLVGDVDAGTLIFNEDGSFSFNPGDDFQNLGEGESTTVTFSYKTVETGSEQGRESEVVTATITVTGTNDAPVAILDSAASTENEALVVDVLANDTDIDATHEFTLDSVASPKGEVSIVNNQLSFNPGTDFDHLEKDVTEEVVITYSMSDEHGEESSSTLTLTITGTNDAPVASEDNASTFENSSVLVDVLTNDSDVDDNAVLTLDNAFIDSGAGGVSIVNNQIAYDPSAFYDFLAVGESAQVVINYTMSDEHGASSSSTLTLTVIGTNDAPVVGNLSGVQAEVIEGLNVFSGGFSISDADNTSHTYSISNITVDGEYDTDDFSVVLNANNTYTVTGDFNPLAVGESTQVTFNYNVQDSDGAGSNLGTVTLTITGTNDGPVAVADFAGMGSFDIDDSVTNGSAMNSVIDVEAGATISFDWEFSTNDYIPFNDSAYVVIDGVQIQLLSDVSTVGNYGSTGTQTFSYTFEDAGSHTISVVVANQLDTAVSSNLVVSNVEGGTVISTTFIGNAAEDEGGYSLITTGGVSESVIETFVAPYIYENDTVSIDVLANDTDVDHNAVFTLDSLDNDSHNVFSISDDDQLVFTPGTEFDYLAVGESTVISVNYTMSDEHGAESSTVATFTITGTNDQPVISKVLMTKLSEVEGSDDTIIEGSVATAVDVDLSDADDITYNYVEGSLTVNQPDNPNTQESWAPQDSVDAIDISSVVVNADGSFSLVGDFNALAEGEMVKVVFKYTADDNQAQDNSLSDANRVVLLITGTNDAPIIEDVTLKDTAEAQSGENTFVGNLVETDLDLSDTHTFELVGNASSSMDEYDSSLHVSVNLDGSYTLSGDFNTLAVGESTTVTFDYKAIDDSGTTTEESSVESVSVTITGTNDGPVAVADGGLYGGLEGEFYGSDTRIHNNTALSDAQEIVDNELADAFFVATHLDYELGNGSLGRLDHLQNFLDHDASSLSSDPSDNNRQSVIVLEGDLVFAEGDYVFKVHSDDGYQILIDGEVAGVYDGNRAPNTNTNDSIHIEAGEHHVEIVYWDQGGRYVLDVQYSYNEEPFVTLNTNAIVTYENDDISIDVLANDTDIDHDAVFTLDSVDELNSEVSHVSIVDNELVFTPGTDFDYLAVGESTQVVISYTMSDEHGASSSATATLTILGTNDTPVVSSVVVHTTEDSSIVHIGLLDDPNASDVDASDDLDIVEGSFQLAVTDGPAPDFNLPNDGVVFSINNETGELVIDPTQFNYLQGAEAEYNEVTITATFDVTDSNGGVVSNEVVLVIDGINDVPSISVESYSTGIDTTNNVNEHETNQLSFGEEGEVTSIRPQNFDRNDFSATSGDSAHISVSGLVLDVDANANYNDAFGFYLNSGESVSVGVADNFDVTMYRVDANSVVEVNLDEIQVDGYYVVRIAQDDVSSADYLLDISINSIVPSHMPVVDNTTAEVEQNYVILNGDGSVDEINPQDIQREGFSFVDEGTISHVVTGRVGASQNGDNWNDGFHFSLTDGESADLHFTDNQPLDTVITLFQFNEISRVWEEVDGADGAGEYIARIVSTQDNVGGAYALQIDIHSSEANYTNEGFVQEDNPLHVTSSGHLRIEDADMGEDYFSAAQESSSYGDFSIDIHGDWSYTLDNSNTEVQALGAGTIITDTFSVTSIDGSADYDVEVTIVGTDDLPQIVLSNVTYHDNLIDNGGFEDPTAQSGSFDVVSGSLGAWNLDEGSNVDLITGYWPSSEGDQSIDLNGTGGNPDGVISQTFSTVTGATYTVTFDMSANINIPDGDDVQLQLSANAETEIFSVNSSDSSKSDMNWQEQSFTFVADDTSTTLAFATLEDWHNNQSGPALDNVHVMMHYNGSSFEVLEDGSLVISAIAISDVDGMFDTTVSEYEVKLVSENGVINPSVVTGTTIEEVNAQLQEITFMPNQDFNGSTQIDISVTDGSAVLNGFIAIPHDSDVIEVEVLPVNDAPVGVDDTVTKVTDHIEVTGAPDSVSATTPHTEVVILDNGSYAIDDHNTVRFWFWRNPDEDNEYAIDSEGKYNEGIRFEFDTAVTSVNIGHHGWDSGDNAHIRVFDSNGNLLHPSQYNHIGSTSSSLVINADVGISKVELMADNGSGWFNHTEFTVTGVTTNREADVVLPFIVDDSMLLVNDTDVEGDTLHVALVDGKLYDSTNTEIGTVSLNPDGDVVVTPNETVEFESDDIGYANFSYVVVDEFGAESEEVTATVDVKLGTVTETEVHYTQTSSEEIIIGTDSDDGDVLSDNVLHVDGGTVDLSNISNIETIALNNGATVTGSSDGINAQDVLDASDDGTLHITSSDGDASDQVSVDTSSLTEVGNGVYSNGSATLILEIETPIEDSIS